MSDIQAPQSPRPRLVPPAVCGNLDLLSPDELDLMARGAATALLAGRLVLGRCLLEIDRRNLDIQWGYSGAVHYAILGLKVAKWEAKEALRVARRLQDLPLLTEAAEAGEIGWAALREVVRVATAETEDLWLQAARTRPMSKLQRLVAHASRGQAPGHPGDDRPEHPDLVEFRFWTTPEEAELLNAALATLSVQAERKLDLREGFTAMSFLVRQGHLRTSPRRLAAAEREVEALVQVREGQDRREMEALERETSQAGRPGSDGVELEAAEAPTRVPGEGRGPEGPTWVPVTGQASKRITAGAERSMQGPTWVPGGGPEPIPEGPTWVLEPESGRPAFARYEIPSASHGEVHEDEEPYLAARPELPWAAAAVDETPCPGEPDLVLATRARVPHWEQEACACGEPGCQHARKRRVPRKTRNHVLRRDGFRCACPDCPNRIWVDLHHVVFFSRGGLTVPPNLCLACPKCHANIHEGRLHVRGNAERSLKWTDRWGRPLGETSPRRRRQSVDWARTLLDAAISGIHGGPVGLGG